MNEIPEVVKLPDHEYFDSFFKEHMPVVRRVVFRIMLDDHSTDDVVQTTFIKAYHKMHTFKGKSKISTWLCRIAYNEALTYRRKNSRQPMSLECVYTNNTAKEKSDGALLSNEAFDEISAALSEIPEHLRTAITLVAIEETPTNEAATIMNCSPATVYWRVHKARKILKHKLGHLL
jgi:RNA polymerase sigma-70 factor, ECF subfamily